MNRSDRICHLSAEELELLRALNIRTEGLLLLSTLREHIWAAQLACAALPNIHIRELTKSEIALLALSHGIV